MTVAPNSPLFNNVAIFNSVDNNGNSYCEGRLWVGSYSPITQKIHFEGEIGDHTIWHGYPDMEWTFEGIISGHTLTIYNNVIIAIQTAIDSCATGVNGTYQTLQDQFGNVYDNAQIRTLNYLSPPQHWIWNNSGTLTNGCLSRVRITGVIQGNTHVGATS